MKKVFSFSLSLILIQLVGLTLCFWLKYQDITPMADLMRLSGRWDFTTDFIAVALIAAPALYAYVHKVKGWRWVVGMFFLPFVLILAGILYYYGSWEYHDYQKYQERKKTYGNAEKVEQVVGVSIPPFKQLSYEEKEMDDESLHVIVCKSTIQWKEQPSRLFYLSLDSLCEIEGSHWKKNGDVYLFDSILDSGYLSRLILSMIITKDEPTVQLSYDTY